MLWYLVVPPFVVVLSFGVLLWLLSRRAGDEEVSRNLSLAKAETLSESHSRSLSRKAFWLKLVEKMASRFKTMSLRIHNFFQHGLEHVRKKRSEIDAIRKHIEGEESEPKTEELPASEPKKRRLGISFGRRKDRQNREATEADNPAVPQPETEVKRPNVSTDDPRPEPVSRSQTESASRALASEEQAPRPVLRREVVKPDARSRKTEKDPREVELLSRIVENPRDISAYEELGDWYFADENMEDAKECYRQALKLHPTNRAIKIKIRKLEKFFEGKAE
jgi:hypothetical protein